MQGARFGAIQSIIVVVATGIVCVCLLVKLSLSASTAVFCAAAFVCPHFSSAHIPKFFARENFEKN